MANCTDAFGTIRVEKVAKEFFAYLKTMQNDGNYHLTENEDIDNATPDKDGNVEFDFSTMGRWSYGNNLDGYMNGEWFKDAPEYIDFINAIEKKGGSVEIEYTDSDPAMDWMGTGMFRLFSEDGELRVLQGFEEQSITIEGYAELIGESQEYAMMYLYGDEVADEYQKYVDKCKKGKKEPVEPDTWYAKKYEEV